MNYNVTDLSHSISIITVNFNNGEGLEKTILSVNEQNYPDVKYIVIDGDSTDNSKEVLKRHDDKIDHWVSEKDTGVYNAMNKGIRKAESEYVLFLNSGDTFYSKNSLKILSDASKADIIYGNILIIEGEKHLVHRYPSELTFSYLMHKSLPHPATLIKRSLFEKTGFYDERFRIVSDWKFFIHAICKHSVSTHHINEIISVFPFDGISSKPENLNLLFKEKDQVLKEDFSRFLPDYEKHDQLKKDIELINKSILLKLLMKSKILRFLQKVKNKISGNKITAGNQSPTTNNKNKFTTFFKDNTFGSDESVSGVGSTLDQTKTIRKKIPELLKKYEVKTMIDAPCGDFNWMKHTDLSSLEKYIGLDIVADIIAENNRKYKNETISFQEKDICKDPLPEGDVLLCRDCLVHLTYNDGLRAIRNIKKSGITYLLVTTFTDRKKNTDLGNSIWRTLNMELPPFNFPKPVHLINEECTEDNNLYTDKSLGLYRLSDIDL